MSEKGQKIIRIKWVRSGIGFNYRQKRVVQSLGLTKLNQEVERRDTPQIRGLVAKVPHLVTIVEATPKAAWTLVPEYTIYPPEAVASKPADTALEASADEVEQLAEDLAAGETATETSAGLGATVVSESTGPGEEEGATATDAASLKEGSPKA